MPDERDTTAALASISGGSPEHIAEIYMAAKAMVAKAREAQALIEQQIIEHIEANGGAPIVVGTLELRATYPRDTRNRKGAAGRTLAALFDACNGDMDAVAGCLYADPFKTKAAKDLLPPDTFCDCFEVVERAKLVEGKAKRELVAVDTRWLPGRE